MDPEYQNDTILPTAALFFGFNLWNCCIMQDQARRSNAEWNPEILTAVGLRSRVNTTYSKIMVTCEVMNGPF
jgi:hypothetical protein